MKVAAETWFLYYHETFLTPNGVVQGLHILNSAAVVSYCFISHNNYFIFLITMTMKHAPVTTCIVNRSTEQRSASALEGSQGSAEGEARGCLEASQKHWPSPRDIEGRISLLAGTHLICSIF